MIEALRSRETANVFRKKVFTAARCIKQTQRWQQSLGEEEHVCCDKSADRPDRTWRNENIGLIYGLINTCFPRRQEEERKGDETGQKQTWRQHLVSDRWFLLLLSGFFSLILKTVFSRCVTEMSVRHPERRDLFGFKPHLSNSRTSPSDSVHIYLKVGGVFVVMFQSHEC